MQDYLVDMNECESLCTVLLKTLMKQYFNLFQKSTNKTKFFLLIIK